MHVSLFSSPHDETFGLRRAPWKSRRSLAMTWSIPHLETRRLTLRPLTTGDAEALLAVYSSREATRYIEITPLEIEEEAEALIEIWLEVQSRRQGARWAIVLKEDGGVAGTCGFNSLNLAEKRGELSYDLAPSHWGRGLVPEAAGAVLRYGYDELRLNRVQACVVPEGAQSMRVLEKLGFQREGVLRAAGFWKGRFWDKVCYSLLRDEWRPGLTSSAGLSGAAGIDQPQPAFQAGLDRRPVIVGDAVHD
jgi:ribosomal-protein-alanine N-acetyltransferase